MIDFHKEHSGKIVDFAGWSLPVMYEGILQEHLAVRNFAGLFDASHMGECFVSGEKATEFVNFLLSSSVLNLKNGRCKYGFLFDENGKCIDDIIAYKLSDRQYFLVLNASNAQNDIEHINKHAKSFNIRVEDVSNDYALLALQGPLAAEVLANTSLGAVDKIKKFNFEIRTEVIVSRTGYTGSDGFEIFCKSGDAVSFAKQILNADSRVKLCGLGARDSLRLEAGFPLYGHEISKDISPIEAGLEKFICFDTNFCGSKFVIQELRKGPSRRVKLFTVEGKRIVRADEVVFAEGQAVGKVLSASWSPILESPIGSAIINVEAITKPLYASVRGVQIPLIIKDSLL